MENYVQYGSPLESLDEDNIHLSKAIKLCDQVVKDNQGRRRFHGAFTGGFSAGYFNSVGTKEGWTPSSFVSSRSKRAGLQVKDDPISYMDEEDLNDFGIASQRIQASSKFEDPIERPLKRKVKDDNSGPIPGQPVLHDLLKPVNITMGMKFLMKLGWRPGQGIGPRLSKQEKRKAGKFKKVYSNSEIKNSSDSDTDTDNFTLHPSRDFAPEDVENSLLINIKSNLFGLGYKPLERSNIFNNSNNSGYASSFCMKEKNKKLSIRGQAFGVGAFEDEDEDIFMKEDMSAYDFDLGSPDSEANKKRPHSRWNSEVLEVLEGFHLSSKPLKKSIRIPLPLLPTDYKPWHQSWIRRFSEKENVGKERLTSDERRNLVNISPEVEIRSGIKKSENKEGKKIDDCKSSETPDDSKFLQYKPFVAYPEKQKRYELYVSSNCIDKGNIFPSHMTEWEKEREKGEFHRAQTFNRPMSFSMSLRFTSAAHEDIATQLQEGLNDMTGAKPVTKEDKTASYGTVLQEDMKAAKQKLYGRLTQIYVDWYPDKLLCKRFNVPNPFPSSTAVGVRSTRKEGLSLFSIIPDVLQTDVPQVNSYDVGESIEKKNNIVDETIKKEEQQENYSLKVPISNPPTIDLFNAIFQDSSDSELEENKDSDTELAFKPHQKSRAFDEDHEVKNTFAERLSEIKNRNETNENYSYKTNVESSVQNSSTENLNALSSSSPNLSNQTASNISAKTNNSKQIEAKGIFRGIDFCALNQYRNLNKEESPKRYTIEKEIGNQITRRKHYSSSSSSSDSDDNDNTKNIDPYPVSESDFEEEYGPALPPHMIKGRISSQNSSTFLSDAKKGLSMLPVSSSLSKTDKKLKKVKKQKAKKKHKHKHKKHKKGSKHKK